MIFPAWARLSGIVIAILVTLGIGYKTFILPTNKTVIQAGGKQENKYIYAQSPRVPIGGCSAYRLRLDAYWDRSPGRQNEKTEKTPESVAVNAVSR